MTRRLFLALLLWAAFGPVSAASLAVVDAEIAAHPKQTGTYILDTGEEALRARAWLADHAERSIEVQYFIWSSDNVGILATEALLRAAERGVKVRVIVDDLLIDAPDKTLLALAQHPGVEIRIYNPKHQVGTPLHKRVLNVVTDFRGVNQRMHDKTFIVDGKVAITGGRNMADEYFDYDQAYTFRDRDVLLLGEAVKAMRENFDAFWASKLSVPVEALYDGWGLMQKNVKVDAAEVQQVTRELHAYAAKPENFAPQVRAAIAATPGSFERLAREMAWGRVDFVHDVPGKNGRRWLLDGGGQSGAALAKLVAGARESIVIQSPYLVLSDNAKALFRTAIARGVKVRILTNSLASTDNVQAFSGYRSQRRQLLKMGLDIREYKPDPANRAQLLSRANPPDTPPVFALHAKSMVIDGRIACVGTFNFDPRSENLNTEVAAVIHHPGLAQRLQAIIEADMRPENSWSARDEPDQYVPLTRRGHVRLWQLLPLKPLL
jgi:putative cardiolipin synthase